MTSDISELDQPPTAAIARIESGNMLPLIQQALAQGIDPDKLSKMLDLHERWTQARAQEQFAAALAAFQSECPRIHKRRVTKGGKWNFTYASLDDIDEVIRPLLAKHGIATAFDSQHSTAGNANVINVTLRIRVGSYFEDRHFGCPVPMDLNASQPQQWGAALSYAKRYAICAALNIVVTDEDTDAANVVSTISATQMVELESLIAETKADVGRFLKWADVDSLDLLPLAKFGKALDMLKQKRGAK